MLLPGREIGSPSSLPVRSIELPGRDVRRAADALGMHAAPSSSGTTCSSSVVPPERCHARCGVVHQFHMAGGEERGGDVPLLMRKGIKRHTQRARHHLCLRRPAKKQGIYDPSTARGRVLAPTASGTKLGRTENSLSVKLRQAFYMGEQRITLAQSERARAPHRAGARSLCTFCAVERRRPRSYSCWCRRRAPSWLLRLLRSGLRLFGRSLLRLCFLRLCFLRLRVRRGLGVRLCAARHGAEDAVHKGNDLRVLIFPRRAPRTR